MARTMNFSPYDAQQQEIDQKRLYAEALRQQGMEAPQGQMAGRIYVGPSWTQGLAQMLKAYGGRKGVDMANEEGKALAGERQAKLAEALKGYGAGGDPTALLDNPDTAMMGAQAIGSERAATRAHELALERQAARLKQQAVSTLNAEEVKAAGLPDGAVVQRDANGKLSVVNDPSKNLTYEQRLALRQAGAMNINNFGQPVAGVDAQGNPVFFQTDKAGNTQVVPGVAPPPKSSLTGKDLATANAKIQAAQNLKRQIAEARERFGQIKGTLAAGPVTGLNPFSEPGQQFDASIDALRSTVTALTRTPGVGAMSDFETRLDQSKIPSRGKYESVTAQQLEELEALADGIINGYSGMVGQEPVAPMAPGAGATGSWEEGKPKKGGAVRWGDL